MKVLIALLNIILVTAALQNPYSATYNNLLEREGQYVPDNSGQYIPDDSGQYIPDHSGDYYSDGLGGYSSDGSGKYTGDGIGTYKEDRERFYKGQRRGNLQISKFSSSDSDGQIGHFPFGKTDYSSVGITSDFKQSPFVSISTVHEQGSGEGIGSYGNTAAASSEVVLPNNKLTSYRNPTPLRRNRDQGQYPDGRWNIVRQSGDVDTDGYHWEYETENGITAEESGKLQNKGTDLEGMKAKGFFQYTGPDNVIYHVGYTADEKGFVAQGNHLPTPPPVPAAILKSLQYLKSAGKL